MAAIKRFFEKRKLDIKFKKAGGGHRLTDEKTTVPKQTSSQGVNLAGRSTHRRVSGEGSVRAGEAALARMDMASKKEGDKNMAAAAMKARMRREMEEEKKRLVEAEVRGAVARAGPTEYIQDSAPVLQTVLFKCPEIGPVVLPKAEMEAYIHEFLLNSLAEEPEMTSALMIHTLNKDKEKVKTCVDTLTKYLDNIISKPSEEKFRKIRINNKAFQERVACLQGAEEFMQASRFHLKTLVDDHEEGFYVMDEDEAKDTDRLNNIKDVLIAAEPIRPQLDRALQVFHPSKSASKFNIPDEFYAITPEELKKEQQRRAEAVEKMGMLRTKAMRERDEQRELRKYRYTLIRVRFPDGVLLQGTFRAMEKLSAVFDFIRNNLNNDWMPFQLSTSTGQKLTEENILLAELGLVPAVVMNFSWDPTVLKEVAAEKGDIQDGNYLKPDVIAMIQDL